MRTRCWLNCLPTILAPLVAFGACGEIVPGQPDSGQPNPGQSDARTSCAKTWLPVSLSDPGFEEMGGAWTTAAASPICRPMEYGLQVTFGQKAACFGTFDLAEQSLWQKVALPPGTEHLRLFGQRCLVTTETSPTSYDVLRIELRSLHTNEPLATLATWSNLDAGAVCDWIAFEASAVVPLEAAEGLLYFEAKLDNSNITSFYLDELEVEAFGCAP